MSEWLKLAIVLAWAADLLGIEYVGDGIVALYKCSKREFLGYAL